MNLIQVHPSGWGFCERGGGPTFTPWGCNYYDPATGWSPRLWEQFDASRFSGLFNAAGELKEQGRAFASLAPGITGRIPTHAAGTHVLKVSWEELVTQPERIKACRAADLAAFGRGEIVDFELH